MAVTAASLAGAAVELDPLVTRWTFGAHEPYTMYRRMGRKATGGVEGSAAWLKGWLDWWDTKAPERMREFGLNALHSRFYKGMGWEEEKKDFPNVLKFVRNCHANGVTALAYVQFATLYYEPMSREIPNLADWAQVDAQGRKRTWTESQYFRWLPCIVCEEWQEYMERILEIALRDGGFDGVMFDNAYALSCYCPRCERAFAEHLASIPDPERRFGLADLRGIRQPDVPIGGDENAMHRRLAQDPVYQEWVRWRCRTMNAVMARFAQKVHSINPKAIVSANPVPFRAFWSHENSLELISFAETQDLLMMQNMSFPAFDRATGVIVNRVRDLKIAAELGKPIVSLCDANAGEEGLDETHYLRPLVEDIAWGGIPTDRTVMSPVRTPGYIDERRFSLRKKAMGELNAFATERRRELSAPSYRPVRILYPSEAVMFCDKAYQGITAAEEIFLRQHVPFGYLIARGAAAPAIPSDCEVVVVANQQWLSQAQIDALTAYAKKGGKLIVTGESGLWDEFGAQRFENPFRAAVAGLPSVSWRDCPDADGGLIAYRCEVKPPADGGRALMSDLARVGYCPAVAFEGLPDSVFVEVKRLNRGFAVMLVNYDPATPVSGASVSCAGTRTDIPTIELYQMMVVDAEEAK